MGPGNHNLRPLESTVHVDHIDPDTLAMPVAFTRNLLAPGEDGLHVSDGHMHIARVIGVLLDHAGNQVSLLPGEGTENPFILSLAEELANNLSCRGSGQSAEVLGRVVVFLPKVISGVRIVFCGLPRGFVLGPDGECACP